MIEVPEGSAQEDGFFLVHGITRHFKICSEGYAGATHVEFEYSSIVAWYHKKLSCMNAKSSFHNFAFVLVMYSLIDIPASYANIYYSLKHSHEIPQTSAKICATAKSLCEHYCVLLVPQRKIIM